MGGFIVFFSGVFLVGSNCIIPENNYECLIDFLSQISKRSYFNLLDLADFMMNRTSFRFRFFVLMQSHTFACNMCRFRALS